MRVKNLIKESPVYISDLKIKLLPGVIIDLEDLVTTEQIEKSEDLKALLLEKKVENVDATEKVTDEVLAARRAARMQRMIRQIKLDKEKLLEDIYETASLTWLEDLMEGSPDQDIVKAASAKYRQLTVVGV